MAECPKTSETQVVDNEIGLHIGFDLRQYLLYLLNRANLGAISVFTDRLKPHHVSLTQWRVLAILHRYGPIRFGDLAFYTMIEPSTLSRVVSSLEREELATRSPSDTDGRGVVVRASEMGLAIADRIVPLALACEDLALKGFTADEVEFLRRLLRRIDANLESLTRWRLSDEPDRLKQKGSPSKPNVADSCETTTG